MTTEAFHEEVLSWTLSLLQSGCAVTIGINGPQGGGKTTLTCALCEKLERLGKRAVTVSVDDFYLTRAEQVALAARFPQNPFFQQRGYPGTHDIALGTRTLDALKSTEAGFVTIPRYDKSAHQGLGDRAEEANWTKVRTPVDVIFFEGWMLGFSRVENPPDSLRDINEALLGYRDWHSRLDAFLQLDPVDYRYVLDWRVEAEERMKAQGKPGMSTDEARAYVMKFLPAYETYLPLLRAKPPAAGRRIQIGRNRLPA